jgi:two-component sensor histidine kinase
LQQARVDGIALVCVADSILANLDTVTAIGMIVVELVFNSYEHAVPEAGGTIHVSLTSGDAGEAILIVSDAGLGFVEQPGSKRHGVGLVRRLMEQVRGVTTRGDGPGTQWNVRFAVSGPPAASARVRHQRGETREGARNFQDLMVSFHCRHQQDNLYTRV